MSFLGFFRNKKQDNIELRSESDDYNTVLGGLLFGKKQSQSNMSLSAVFAAIELISSTIAQIPIVISRITDGLNSVDKTHNLNFVFNNSLISKWHLVKNMFTDLYRFGNGYAYIKRANDGTPLSLQYCPAGTVSIEYNKRKQELYYRCSDVKQGRIEPINMIHIYKNANDDGDEGIGIFQYASQTLALAGYAESAANTFFSSGCQINGVLTVQGTLSDKQKAEIRQNWSETHTGGKNGVAVLPGNMQYQTIGSNASESQLLESRLFNLQEIARFFNISPTLLGDLTHSSYSTLEQSTLQYLVYTLMPLITMFENELNRKLLLPSEVGTIRIDLDEEYIIKADKTSMASYLSTLVSNGIITINEARTKLNLNPVEGGDRLMIAYTDVEQNTINKDDDNVSDTDDSVGSNDVDLGQSELDKNTDE